MNPKWMQHQTKWKSKWLYTTVFSQFAFEDIKTPRNKKVGQKTTGLTLWVLQQRLTTKLSSVLSQNLFLIKVSLQLGLFQMLLSGNIQKAGFQKYSSLVSSHWQVWACKLCSSWTMCLCSNTSLLLPFLQDTICIAYCAHYALNTQIAYLANCTNYESEHNEKYRLPQCNAPTIDLACQPISSVTNEPEVTSAISNINIWSDCQR